LTDLDISGFINPLNDEDEDNFSYDLFGISNHYGGLGGGHYTAYTKSPWKDGKWYQFDDSRVSGISNPKTVITESAYLLFYVRKGSEFAKVY